VFWPDGRDEEWYRVEIDRIVTIRQGTGRNLKVEG
jgi:hypothetical protein